MGQVMPGGDPKRLGRRDRGSQYKVSYQTGDRGVPLGSSGTLCGTYFRALLSHREARKLGVFIYQPLPNSLV